VKKKITAQKLKMKFRCCYIYNSILLFFGFLIGMQDDWNVDDDVDEMVQIEFVCDHELGREKE